MWVEGIIAQNPHVSGSNSLSSIMASLSGLYPSSAGVADELDAVAVPPELHHAGEALDAAGVAKRETSRRAAQIICDRLDLLPGPLTPLSGSTATYWRSSKANSTLPPRLGALACSNAWR